MKKKFITEVDCFHNGRYYEAGQTVECDCKFCQEEKVPYFKKIKDVSRETNIDEKKEEKVEEKVEIKEEKPKKKNKLVITE